MEWSDRFATGIPRIDDQHRTLLRMLEDFRAALDEGAGEHVYEDSFQGLTLYARMHFSFEEECMERHRCPVSRLKRAAHGRFMSMLGEFHRRYAEDGFARRDARRLVGALDRWLERHIGRIDLQLLGSAEGER